MRKLAGPLILIVSAGLCLVLLAHHPLSRSPVPTATAAAARRDDARTGVSNSHPASRQSRRSGERPRRGHGSPGPRRRCRDAPHPSRRRPVRCR